MGLEQIVRHGDDEEKALLTEWIEGSILREDGKLNKNGLELIARLTEHVPHDLWGPAFLPLSTLGVQENIELIVIQGGHALWIWREDEFFRGWHAPGTKRRQRETYQEGATRCAALELGCDVRVIKLIGAVDHHDSPRFHEAVVLLLCELVGSPTKPFAGEEQKVNELKWFDHCPEDVVSFQLRYWPHMEPYLKKEVQQWGFTN